MNMGAREPSAAPSPTQAVQAGETGASPMGGGRRWVSASLPPSLGSGQLWLQGIGTGTSATSCSPAQETCPAAALGLGGTSSHRCGTQRG